MKVTDSKLWILQVVGVLGEGSSTQVWGPDGDTHGTRGRHWCQSGTIPSSA